MKGLLALAVITIHLFLGACTPDGAPADKHLAKADNASPAAPTRETPRTAFDLTFGFRNGIAADDPRIVRVEDSACGDLPVARVSSIPRDDKVLVADPVVEFDAAGKDCALGQAERRRGHRARWRATPVHGQ